MLVLFGGCMVAGQVLAVVNGNFRWDDLPLGLAYTAFMVVGALIVVLRPRNAVGWIFCAVGLLAAAGVFAMEYAEFAFVTRPSRLPGRIWAAWYAAWFWFPLLGLTLLFTILLFPTGRPLSRRWHPLLWVSAVALVAVTVLASLNPAYHLQNEDVVVTNPIGIAGVGDIEQSPIGSFLFGVFLSCLLLAAVHLILRFRRSSGVERQQLKMFTFAGALVAIVPMADDLLAPVELGDALWGLTVATVPVSAGIAILRYRLYEIDRIINRTIVYALVTGTLVAVYTGTVFIAGTVVVGPSDDLTVAAATLAAAAAFRPVLQRMQSFVDRRFYRRKYDAAKTIDAFGARLREETDLDELTADLVAVVRSTMQPAHVSLWLRRQRPEP